MQNETRTNGSVKIIGALLMAMVGVCGLASRAKAQELVKATFTLSGQTRFGSTVLPAGRYTISVEPVTGMRAVGRPVAFTARPESGVGPMVAILATLSQEGCEGGLALVSDGTGFVAQSMCLDKQQLKLHFDLSKSSGKLL
jgi:hypothetical protein